MKRWLVFGLSGQVGVALREGLAENEAELVAVSRQPPAEAPGLCWVRGELGPGLEVGQDFDAIISLGPLDHFSRWFEQAGLAPARVIALGSTSVHSKLDSPDAAERALATRLAEAEARLAAACTARGCAGTLLRPTLIYGGGEQNLSRIVGLARRWRWLPLPGDATGLRQPVFAADLAAAVLACLRSPAPIVGSYDLPGGETLAYDEMLRRVLAEAVPGARILKLPAPLFRLGIRLLRRLGVGGVGEGLLSRFDRDLVFDAGPARRDLGYAPRPFQPRADMFRSDAAAQQRKP
jgi:nucleoside-diphosphate-sugar epimerase